MLQTALDQLGFVVYGVGGRRIAKWTRRRDLFTRATDALSILAIVIMIGVALVGIFTTADHEVMIDAELTVFLAGGVGWIVCASVEEWLKKAQEKALVGGVCFGQSPVALLLLKIGAIRGTYQLLSVQGQGSLIQGLTLLACTADELPGVLLRDFQRPLIVTAATIEVSTAWEVDDTALANLYYAVSRAPDRKEIAKCLKDLQDAQTFPPR